MVSGAVQAASVTTNGDTPFESRKAFFSSNGTLGDMAMKAHAWRPTHASTPLGLAAAISCRVCSFGRRLET